MVGCLLFLAAGLVAKPTISPRLVVDLDGGWQFARVPSPPSLWNGPDAVPTSAWRVLSVSSEETAGEDGRASNAFDGNPNTIWHTEWSKRQTPYPHELVIDMGSRVEAIGLRILPRQTSPNNGKPNHFELYLSSDRSAWGPPVLVDAAPDSSDLYTHGFPAKSGRYLRLVFKDGHRPEPYLALSEIGLIRKVGLKDQKDWASQYNIASVQVGSGRFDLSDKLLEQTKIGELASLRPGDWQSATLPHAAWIRPLHTSAIWQGVAYYRRTLTRPPGTEGEFFELSVEGAMQNSDLWFNGRHIAFRRGGYLPLVADLTPWMRSKNEVLIRVDNRDNPLIPPGKPQQELDFMYGSGLYRNARLTVTNRLHITDPLMEDVPRGGGINVTFRRVDSRAALIDVQTHLRNAQAASPRFFISQSLIDDAGRTVATTRAGRGWLAPHSSEQYAQELEVRNPRLWFPDSPNLYRLRTVVSLGSKVFDQVDTIIGIRKVEVSREQGFVLNGRSIRLVGTNRHQDYPWVGPALSDGANARDALLIRRAGHNIVRLSHYPQSPEFLDACDRVGLMTIPCIPGWQFINRDPRFEARVEQDIHELIRRDRNHPCVAFWEASLNETYPPGALAKRWKEVAKSESVDGSVITAGDAANGATWDVAYNQWKEDLSRPQDNAPSRPGYIREYGDYEFGGAYSTSRVTIRQGMTKLLQETWNHVWSHNKFRPQYPWTMGDGTWEMFDHNVPWEFAVSASGLADLFRRPKPSYWFYASQVAAQPMVKLASTWQPGASTRDVVLFTNCNAVQLWLNGRMIAIQKPVAGPSTAYDHAKPFDGSNTDHLDHPPIVFRDVPYEPGILKAVGMRAGRPVASDVVDTAGKPVGLKVWLDDLGVATQPNDLVFIRAALVDAGGHICVDETRQVRFKVTGDAALAGEGRTPTEMGVASSLVRTSAAFKRFRVTAVTPDGLTGPACLVGQR